MSLEEIRDLMVVLMGVSGVLFLLVLVAFLGWLFLMYRRIRGGIATIRRQQVDPMVRDAKAIVGTGRGTVYFVNHYGVQNARTGIRVWRWSRRITRWLNRARVI